MSYGKHTSQADRNERKLYPQRETHPRPRKSQPRWTDEEAALYKRMFGVTPLEAQALKMAGLTVEEASQPVDTGTDYYEDAIDNRP